MKDHNSLHEQHIILNQNGLLLQSCDSIFDTSQFDQFLDHFPLVDSIFSSLLELPVGKELSIEKVAGNKHLQKGIYDFLFYVSLNEEKERQIHWIIRNKSHQYLQLRTIQQQTQEFVINQEVKGLSNKTLQRNKIIWMKQRINSILLVDDDATLNMINMRFIELLDVAQQVAEVRNGKEAVDFVLKQNNFATANQNSSPQPEIIILDLNMPVMGGLEFLEKYKAMASTSNKSKIIVLSSSNRPQEREKALAFDSVIDYWVKPIAKEKWLALKSDYGQIA